MAERADRGSCFGRSLVTVWICVTRGREFFLPVGVAQYDEKGCRSVPMLGRYRGNLAEMTLDFENMFSAVELRLRKDSFALEPIKVKQVILQGNDGEILAGSIKVVASRQELPDSVCEERKVSPCVVLDCGSGVELTEESTSFYLPVLPVEFRRGYSLTVVTDRDSGNMFRIQCGGKFPVRLKKVGYTVRRIRLFARRICNT